MEYKITTLEPKILIGKNKVMSFAMDKTKELWQSFMPERDKVINRLDENYYSMQIYPQNFSFETFDPTMEFTKWAAVEVDHADNMDHGMNKYLCRVVCMLYSYIVDLRVNFLRPIPLFLVSGYLVQVMN